MGDGADVMVSSRKEDNVKKAVESLKGVGGGKVEGMVCHVGKSDHREKLIKEVCEFEWIEGDGWEGWSVICWAGRP